MAWKKTAIPALSLRRLAFVFLYKYINKAKRCCYYEDFGYEALLAVITRLGYLYHDDDG